MKNCLTGVKTSPSMPDLEIASITDDGDHGSHISSEEEDDDQRQHDEENQVPNKCFEINDKSKDPNAYVKEGEMCSICLLEFEQGDEIVLPQNENCSHIFHKDCIMEWLVRHNDCPCCRVDYVTAPTEDVIQEV